MKRSILLVEFDECEEHCFGCFARFGESFSEQLGSTEKYLREKEIVQDGIQIQTLTCEIVRDEKGRHLL